VTRVRITGLRTGVGITAIDTLNLKIYNNVIKYASIGLKVVADQKTITRLKVIGNNFSNASEFGIQYADSGSFKIGYSTISNNILKYIGGVALFINASDLELRDANYNDFYGSNNGIFFTGGSLKLIKLHLEYYQIKKVGVSIYNADALVADRLGLMPGGPATAAQDRVCLSALAVKNVQLSNSYIRGCDIGVALVSSGGVPSTATITNSAIINNAIAGIMIKTEDQISPFGAVNIFSNNLRGNPPDNAIWLIDPATIASDSIRYGNGF
jgi:hypothetical protein